MKILNTMHTGFHRLLKFLRLTDEGTISLTNVGLIVVLVKVATAVNPSFEHLAALLLTLLSYNFKKHVARVDGKKALGAEVGALTDVVGKMTQKMKETHERLQVVENRTTPGSVLSRGR